MDDGKELFQGICKICGGIVTEEWREFVTYPCVLRDGQIFHALEDETVYSSEGDLLGYHCNGDCMTFIETDEVLKGGTYTPKNDKQEAVNDALNLLSDIYWHLENRASSQYEDDELMPLIDEMQMNLAHTFGLVGTPSRAEQEEADASVVEVTVPAEMAVVNGDVMSDLLED